MDPRIPPAFASALRSALVDSRSLRWVAERRNTMCVRISGRLYYARVALPTEASLREALADCVRQHCTVEAMRLAAAETVKL